MSVDSLLNNNWNSFAPLSERAKLCKQAFSGLPTRKNESFKYADFRFLGDWEFKNDSASPTLDPKLALTDAHLLVFAGGRYCPELSKIGENSGLNVSTDGFAVSQPVQRELDSPFFNIGNVAATAAVNVQIDEATTLDKPIQLLHISTPDSNYHAPQIFVSVGKGSQIKLFELFASSNANFANPNLHVTVADDASCEYARYQNDSLEAAQVGAFSFDLQENAKAHILSVSQGSQFYRLDGNCYLNGRNANCTFNGLYLADGSRFVDHHANIEHLVAETYSSQLFKGILADQCRAVFNGRVYMAKQAQQSDSSQLNKNLALSNTAEINTKPELAIEADDVKAAHGATVGQISEEEVFYLMSRGIPRHVAQQRLGYGFAIEVIESFPDKKIQEFMLAQVHRSLDKFFGELNG